MIKNKPSRSPEFDILKGLAIFLVVMGHVLLNAADGDTSPVLFRQISVVHMPLFFFISGWWCMKLASDGSLVAPKLGAKALRLLPPAIAVGALWCMVSPHLGLRQFPESFVAMLTDGAKGGYWFPVVLFECMAVYALVARCIRGRGPVIAISVGVVFWMALMAMRVFVPATIADTFCIPSVALHFPAFYAGVLARKYSDTFARLCSDRWSLSAAIVLLALTLIAFGEVGVFAYPQLIRPLMYQVGILSLAIVAMAAMKTWQAKGFGRIASAWAYLGRRSFAIYLLHYFFLFPLGTAGSFMSMFGYSFVPCFAVGALVASLVIGAVLVVDYVICLSGPLAYLLVGEPLNTASKA